MSELDVGATDAAIARANDATRRAVGRRRAAAGDGAGGTVRLGTTELAQVKLDNRPAGAPVVAYLGPWEPPASGQLVEIVPTTDRAPQGWRVVGAPPVRCPVYAMVYHVAGIQPPFVGGEPGSVPGISATEFGFIGPGQAVAPSATAAGDFWVTDEQAHRIYAVTSTVITHYAGNGDLDVSGLNNPITGLPGDSTAAGIGVQYDLVADLYGTVYSVYFATRFDADTGQHNPTSGLMRFLPGGTLQIICGGLPPGMEGDGGRSELAAVGTSPRYITLHPTDGSLVFADTGNNSIRRIAPPLDGKGIITTLVGVPASVAGGLAFDPDGNLYWIKSTTLRDVVRRTAAGVVSTVYTLPVDLPQRMIALTVDRCGRILVLLDSFDPIWGMQVGQIEGGALTVISNLPRLAGLATPSPQPIATATYATGGSSHLRVAADDTVYISDGTNRAVRQIRGA